MKNIVYIATSLDGFIAREDGGLDWLTGVPNPENSDFGFSEFMAGIDAVLMGRLTFETVRGFKPWPYAKTVFVLSNTLTKVPAGLEGKAEIVSGSLAQVLGKLEGRGIKRLYVDGGKTVQSFLREDLIDEAWVVRKPTEDGVVTSLELFDAQGEAIATLFGKRKPGIPEIEDWRVALADATKHAAGA